MPLLAMITASENRVGEVDANLLLRGFVFVSRTERFTWICKHHTADSCIHKTDESELQIGRLLGDLHSYEPTGLTSIYLGE